MKKTRLFLVLVLALSTASAAVPATTPLSARPLVGAILALPGAAGMAVANLPGYGLQITTSVLLEEPQTPQEVADTLRGVVLGLAPSVVGVPEGEWVSVAVGFFTNTEPEVVVRVEPGRPETLEVWVGGELQP